MFSHLQTTCWNISDTDFPFHAPLAERLQFLVRYAVLAPSSHNTQPWLFRVHEDQISLLLDYRRWLRVADDDQRELHISVGCALENLLVAAEHFGFGHEVELLPESEGPPLAAKVRFREDGERSSYRSEVLFPMIPVRHTNHGEYDGRPIPENALQQFHDACVEDGIELHLTHDDDIRWKVDDLVVRGDAIEFADPAFREELAHWIGQGVFGTGWLMSKIGQLAVSHLDIGGSQAKKDSRILMSSPVLGLISSRSADQRSQLRVGQVYQRISLLAASHGIWCQPISQIVQVPELKLETAALISQPGLTPQHPFRMGFAEAAKHHTPRRPVEEVLV